MSNKTTKLPPGAAKWWNLPIKDLTDAQREIKRKYARELYHNKKASNITETNISEMHSELHLLKSIIENYEINLKRLFDNYKMTDSLQMTQNVDRPNVPQLTLEEYKEFVKQKPAQVLGNETEHGFLYMALRNAKIIRQEDWRSLAETKNEKIPGVRGMFGCKVKLKGNYDILYGLKCQGAIQNITLLYISSPTIMDPLPIQLQKLLKNAQQETLKYISDAEVNSLSWETILKSYVTPDIRDYIWGFYTGLLEMYDGINRQITGDEEWSMGYKDAQKFANVKRVPFPLETLDNNSFQFPIPIPLRYVYNTIYIKITYKSDIPFDWIIDLAHTSLPACILDVALLNNEDRKRICGEQLQPFSYMKTEDYFNAQG